MKQSLLFFAILLFVLSSCQREVMDTTSPPPTPPPPTARILKRVIITDTINGCTHTIRFNRDNTNRITSLVFKTCNGGYPSTTSPQTFQDSFFYQGTNTLPYKITSTLTPASYAYDDSTLTDIITYNSQGIKKKEIITLNGNHPYITRNFNITGNYMVDSYFNDSLVWNGQNMKYMYRDCTPVNPTLVMYFDEYDNRINPYLNLNIAPAIFKRFNYPVDDLVSALRNSFRGHLSIPGSANNITKWRYVNRMNGVASFEFKASYNYDNAGYPLKKKVEVRENGRPYDLMNFTYEYY